MIVNATPCPVYLQLVGSLLISVAVYARYASIVTNLPIVGGILACGIILLITSLLGLAAAVRHHQVMLFFVSFIKDLKKLPIIDIFIDSNLEISLTNVVHLNPCPHTVHDHPVRTVPDSVFRSQLLFSGEQRSAKGSGCPRMEPRTD